MNPTTRIKLSVMMFLQYFVWGAWMVTLATFLEKTLKFEGLEVGWCFSALPIAAMISPFIVGMIADRFFSTERILAVFHLIGAGLMYYTSRQTEYNGMLLFLLLYALTYMPTLALTNSLSFHHMENPSKQFPGIRVWGTIGWIVAGALIGWLRFSNAGSWSLSLLVKADDPTWQSIEPTRYPMLIASVAAVVMGVYCFFLPHTPPPRKGQKTTVSEVLGLEAFGLMKEKSFSVFVICSFLICIPLQFYYTFTNPFLQDVGMADPAFKMTFGQMSEIFFMLVMPVFFIRLGVKKMLLIGMAMWAIRYVLFSKFGAGSEWMLYTGIIVHGICYDFFFVTGQIYVDQKAPRQIRGAAQGFIAFVTLGVGGFIGSLAAGKTKGFFTNSMFRADEGPGEFVDVTDWATFWAVPAILALVVMALFAILFNDKSVDPAVAEALEETAESIV